jgi:C4-dicarboxylate transporter, DctM subunit
MMAAMSPLELGIMVTVVTVAVLMTGAPVAFSLGIVAIGFLLAVDGTGALSIIPNVFYGGLDDFALLSIPMFILMGGAIASSRAGPDLYEALDRWLYRVPGGLMVSNIGACAIFAALSGSSPATCAAIGKMGIPEMRKRGYPASVATGSIAAGGTLGILIPPSVTMIVYGIATETSIGRLFIAGLLPGLMLTGLFIAWGLFASWRQGYRFAAAGGVSYSLRQHLAVLPRVGPFLVIITGILWVLYGGVATPSEAAGVGALFCIILVAVIYRMYRPVALWRILRAAMGESAMIMMIIAAAALFSYMMSSLFITQSLAMWIGELEVNRWVLMAFINLFLLVAGFFLPPVAVILMTAPTLLPMIEAVGFDPIWFAVVLTINMEIGLITPPVGLNLYVINGIAPDVRLQTILWGALPFMVCMVLGIILLCFFPEIAMWLPNAMMGHAL